MNDVRNKNNWKYKNKAYFISEKENKRTQLENEFFKTEKAKEIFEDDNIYFKNLHKLIFHDILNNVNPEIIKLKYGAIGIFILMEIMANKNIPISKDLQKYFYLKENNTQEKKWGKIFDIFFLLLSVINIFLFINNFF
ncbi:hypothetical protein [Fusobacterium ulcerans]|uniref:hypothetical protein n=1 Tax=Fusobacterium ulcerans TaxID=861 RepID=UPI00241F6C88|nr:hypothetical protein [Fusobacterium ulcerans]